MRVGFIIKLFIAGLLMAGAARAEEIPTDYVWGNPKPATREEAARRIVKGVLLNLNFLLVKPTPYEEEPLEPKQIAFVKLFVAHEGPIYDMYEGKFQSLAPDAFAKAWMARLAPYITMDFDYKVGFQLDDLEKAKVICQDDTDTCLVLGEITAIFVNGQDGAIRKVVFDAGWEVSGMGNVDFKGYVTSQTLATKRVEDPVITNCSALPGVVAEPFSVTDVGEPDGIDAKGKPAFAEPVPTTYEGASLRFVESFLKVISDPDPEVVKTLLPKYFVTPPKGVFYPNSYVQDDRAPKLEKQEEIRQAQMKPEDLWQQRLVPYDVHVFRPNMDNVGVTCPNDYLERGCKVNMLLMHYAKRKDDGSVISRWLKGEWRVVTGGDGAMRLASQEISAGYWGKPTTKFCVVDGAAVKP